jgi:hypothetical protein
MHGDSGKRGAVGVAFIVAAFTVAAGLALLTWIGGELHYRNCLTSVELRYPVAYHEIQGSGNAYREVFEGTETKFGFVFYQREGRRRAIAGCSRWP